MPASTSQKFAFTLLLVIAGIASAQTAAVTGQVVVRHARTNQHGNQDVVLWLKPLTTPVSLPEVSSQRFRMTQKNKQFEPHLLVVPVGTAVEFPNQDPFFHNVFSLYKGKKFDLGLYEAGSTKTVRFERPGVSFVFCNIHPGMSAYIVAVETPYYAVSDARGQIAFPRVAPGLYRLQIWYERAESGELEKLSRNIEVRGTGLFLGTIEVRESEHFVPPHTNKYGKPYEADRSPY